MGKDKMKKYSIEYVESLRGENGGFSKEALAKIGVSWPPKKGWMAEATGLTKSQVRRRNKTKFKEKSSHEITRILCSRLDKRKARLHESGIDHLLDQECNNLRDAIKNFNHSLRAVIAADLNSPAPKKSRKKKTRGRKSKKAQPAYSKNIEWLPRDEWEKQTAKFYKSQQWKELRYETLRKHGGACQCCGARAIDGVQIHVDHIKPRSKYPELQYDPDNLQLLCEDCNFGKSNYYNDDWRVKMEEI